MCSMLVRIFVGSLASSLLLVSCATDSDEIPNHLIALNDLGVAKMGQFQYSAAFDDFAQVVDQVPHWNEAVVNLAIATLNRQNPGDEQLTLETLAIVLQRDPLNERALYTSGIVNLYLGNTDQAVEYLAKAVELNPNDAFATYFLGQANLQAESYQDAQTWLLRTLELNPSMRSAYWAASTASRRLGEVERALALIEEYQSFEHNPLSVSAGFSYKQMGPKAEAKSIKANVTALASKPEGPLFQTTSALIAQDTEVVSITSFDINGDGRWDVLYSTPNFATVLLRNETGSFEATPITGLGAPHTAAAWGDFENNGSTEFIRCTDGGIEIVSEKDSGWEVTHTLSTNSCDSLRVLDSDHDGDLDVLKLGADGVGLFINKLDGTFDSQGIGESPDVASPVSQAIAADIDRDRDVDLILVGKGSQNRIWRNELTWRFTLADGLGEFPSRGVRAATVVDVDQNGILDIVTASDERGIEVWSAQDNQWASRRLEVVLSNAVRQLDAHDFDGDGRKDLLVVHEQGVEVLDLQSNKSLSQIHRPNTRHALVVYSSDSQSPELVTASDQGVQIWKAGDGRYEFLAISPSGKTSADQMRSNASGIGTFVKLRADSRWSLSSNHSRHSGPSQSLQPMMFGSGGASKANYIEMLWPDGVTQSEIDLNFGELHHVAEAQRQLASCPVVFVWNGHKYEFVSDVLGVAALGYFFKPGQTTPVRPYERLLLPDGLLTPRDGVYEVKIGEPMEEVLYLDHAKLIYFDVPEGWSLVLDERLNVMSENPTGEPIYFRKSWRPARAFSNRAHSALNQVLEKDLVAPDPGAVDRRFIGLLEEPQILTIEFEDALPTQNAVLVADGWVEFPYSQTSFSAHQAGVEFSAPTLEGRDGEGKWFVIAEQFGYPAGMPRSMAMPLPNLPAGTTAIRLTSNLEIYWDRIRVVLREELTGAMTQSLPLRDAEVRVAGYAKRTTGDQRVPYYDYDQRTPYWDAKYAAGFYTKTGEVFKLVSETDSIVAIIGSGEEVHLEFQVDEDPPEGVKRFYALEFRGWAKDMDLYTNTGDQVEPIPVLGELTNEMAMRRDELHSKYNVRFQSGAPSL